MLVHWWQRIGIGASLGWRRLHNSGAFAGQCCQVIGVGALVGRWGCHGIGADALVLKGEGPANQLEGREERKGRGEREMHSMTQHIKGAVAFWGDLAVHWVVLLGGWAAVQWTMRTRAAAFGGTLRCIGQCCRGRDGCARHIGGGWGEKVMRRATWRSWAAAFRDNAGVQWALLSVERRLCNRRRWGMQRCGFILFAHGHG
jgi:hypothetical protein